MTLTPTTISPEVFSMINADVSAYIKKKLLAMDVEVADLDLHNSSRTKTLRIYLTVTRSANLKALSMAEQILISEIYQRFAVRPDGLYWRYLPDFT